MTTRTPRAELEDQIFYRSPAPLPSPSSSPSPPPPSSPPDSSHGEVLHESPKPLLSQQMHTLNLIEHSPLRFSNPYTLPEHVGNYEALTPPDRSALIRTIASRLTTPRIVCLGLDTQAPCFKPWRADRGVELGWRLVAENAGALARLNAYALARYLLDKYYNGVQYHQPFWQVYQHYQQQQQQQQGEQETQEFTLAHLNDVLVQDPVWDPIRHCSDLSGEDLDLSLSTDVYWLPWDLHDFVAVRNTMTPAEGHAVHCDESRVRRLMIASQTLEREIKWASRDMQQEGIMDGGPYDTNNGQECESPRTCMQRLLPLRVVLNEYFPSCRELVVLMYDQSFKRVWPEDRQGGLLWDDLHYRPYYQAREDFAEVEARRRQKPDENERPYDIAWETVWEDYYELVRREGLDWPNLSFAWPPQDD